MSRTYVGYNNVSVPKITGGKGKGGGKIAPNTLFSTDVLFLTVGLGEGPVYRINPNGSQDIQIQDSAIEDLLNMDTDGSEKTDKFFTAYSYGTTTQSPLPIFGDNTVTPQMFASAVTLRKGNLSTIPKSSVLDQETSEYAWDSLRFIFEIDALHTTDSNGNVSSRSLSIHLSIYNRTKTTLISQNEIVFTGKTDKAWKKSIEVVIPSTYKADEGYIFTIEKTSDDSDTVKIGDSISVVGWEEIENTPQAYPRTALIGYSLKATDEHTGGVPNMTSLIKGLIIKVPSNYNQPILANGEIDWREVEAPTSGPYSYIARGYRLQKQGTGTVLTSANPQIYVGTWDGSFVYSWTQNPVWILYDILTNTTYGLGIPEEHIDKYRFYQIAQYCDACDPKTGKFMGVKGLADGSFRYKPRLTYTATRENQLGLPKSTEIIERRFITDITISEQEQGMDILNRLAATFRAALVYAGGKITLAIDMPEEYPVMLFNEANIKEGSFQISGIKNSDIITGVDATYIEPTNHFKRETLRVDTADANDGSDLAEIENIATIDLAGVTRRSQAMRAAQYQIAASRYLRRHVSFIAGTDALSLSPGDVIAVASQGTGIAYGYGGRVSSNSFLGSSNVYLEHYTVPSLSAEVFTSNTGPIALRVIKSNSDRMDLYVLDNQQFTLNNTGNVSTGVDSAEVVISSSFNMTTKQFQLFNGFTANNIPTRGDLWSIGEIVNTDNYYSSKSGKLFKITELKRDSDTEEVHVNAIEYIPDIYEDSDTFINYEPTAYTDIVSPFATPPTPKFSLSTKPRTTSDGSVVIDGILSTQTDTLGYGQKYQTEYYVSYPTTSVLSSNAKTVDNTLYIKPTTTADLANNTLNCELVGKNGFSTPIGEIKLLCTNFTVSAGKITMDIRGLNNCEDPNFGTNVLQVYQDTQLSILENALITIPVVQRMNTVKPGFIGYGSSLTEYSTPITSFNTTTNKIVLNDSIGVGGTVSAALPTPPFYCKIHQILHKDYSSSKTFYISGLHKIHNQNGYLTSGVTNVIKLEIKPNNIADVSLWIDGIERYIDGTTIKYNLQAGNSTEATITYVASDKESQYRLEIDCYLPPPIEPGDKLEVGYANVFYVTDTTYVPGSASYSTSKTANAVYTVTIDNEPNISLTSYYFTNTTENPVGILNNVKAGWCSLDYDSIAYPGTYRLANSRVYSIDVGSTYEKLFNSDSQTLENLPLGVTSVKARNRNTIGRVSPFVQKSIVVKQLPIQKVENIEITESLYIEQLGGAAVRVTCSFEHIVDQSITDYEISYKLIPHNNDSALGLGSSPLKSWNTVKVAASAVDSDGKIRYTVDNIDRGVTANEVSITFKVTPLNRDIRGVSAIINQDIIGKTAKPKNIKNFVAGQQSDMLTFLWSYETDTLGNLVDLDLKEVEIRKIIGTVPATYENFIKASDVLKVSAGSVRKSTPIDTYGTYTYLAMTRDTSGNLSDTPVGVTITTTKPNKNTTIFAYNEDDPSEHFSSILNTNANEFYYPSFSNTATGGIKKAGSTYFDNANASASGWATVVGSPTDLIADTTASYITPIRDLGQVMIASVLADVAGTQQIQGTYYDQHEVYLTSTSKTQTVLAANVLVDNTNGGIGSILGYSNTAINSGRYDSNNCTWMTGPANGNVWAIWNKGQYVGDVANANCYALIAGLINANAIALGDVYYANGIPAHSNSFANITAGSSSYALVNLKQYNDYNNATYIGDPGAVNTSLYIRTATDSPYYANGLVNTAAFASSGDGWMPFETSKRTLKYFQLKHQAVNYSPDQYDYTLDKFRYSVDKELVVAHGTYKYDSDPKVIDISSYGLLNRPTIQYTILNQLDSVANPAIAITTAASNTSLTFRLVSAKGTGAYQANSSANVMITITGV